MTAPEAAGDKGAHPAAGQPGASADEGGAPPLKQRRCNDSADVHSAGGALQPASCMMPAMPGLLAGVPGLPGADDDSTATNLESSLQSCTAHRERIEQMLREEPTNQNLLDLREQLTEA